MWKNKGVPLLKLFKISALISLTAVMLMLMHLKIS
jgi:hypothetical protein